MWSRRTRALRLVITGATITARTAPGSTSSAANQIERRRAAVKLTPSGPSVLVGQTGIEFLVHGNLSHLRCEDP
jgi:hypothetical protein